MTGQFQEVVEGAFATFLREVTAAAEREVIEAIRSAFAQAMRQAGDAVAMALAPVPPSNGRAHRRADRRAAARIDRVAVRDRVVAFIGENPGWTAVQLGSSLGIHSSKLRHRLRELVANGAIRSEERPFGVGRQRRRMYYAVASANGAHARAEPAAVPTEPPAVHVEAA